MGITCKSWGKMKSLYAKQANRLAKEQAVVKAAKEAKRKPKSETEN